MFDKYTVGAARHWRPHLLFSIPSKAANETGNLPNVGPTFPGRGLWPLLSSGWRHHHFGCWYKCGCSFWLTNSWSNKVPSPMVWRKGLWTLYSRVLYLFSISKLFTNIKNNNFHTRSSIAVYVNTGITSAKRQEAVCSHKETGFVDLSREQNFTHRSKVHAAEKYSIPFCH